MAREFLDLSKIRLEIGNDGSAHQLQAKPSKTMLQHCFSNLTLVDFETLFKTKVLNSRTCSESRPSDDR